MSPPFVSIVIPVLHDTEPLARLLSAHEPRPDVEIIVVSGAAPDAGLEAVTGSRQDVRLLPCSPGRGRQMNAGASAARGRWLLFLHADTRLAPAWLDEVQRADEDASIVGGSFRFRLDVDAWQARVIERFVRWRVRWLDLAYGDQALFVKRDSFHAVGGYREWPLMEDVDLIRRVRRAGRLYHSSRPAVTSARRWERDGWWRRTGENLLLQALFFAGVSPRWLARRYVRRKPGSSEREALVVMARAPSDLRGKSRLTRDIPVDHLGLRRAILLDTLDAAARVRRADLVVAYEPADALPEFEALTRGDAQLIPQRADMLGDRMSNVFRDVFSRGYTSVVMIGSDLPSLPSGYVEQAFDRLRDRSCDLVIGPAADGGYYLIGLRRLWPQLFESIPWSSAAVLSRTWEIAETLHLKVAFTPAWYDVDEADDLRRAVSEAEGATRTRSWAANHQDFE